MELIINPGGAVLLDGAAGTIDRDPEANTGAMRVDRDFRAFRLYGPFGQGYNFDVFSAATPRLTLTYGWRDGVTIYLADEPAPAAPQLWIEPNSNVLSGNRPYGNFTYYRDRVRVVLDSTPAPFDLLSCALLVALDVMYAQRILLFARSPF
jgi:hypothetical protein